MQFLLTPEQDCVRVCVCVCVCVWNSVEFLYKVKGTGKANILKKNGITWDNSKQFQDWLYSFSSQACVVCIIR